MGDQAGGQDHHEVKGRLDYGVTPCFKNIWRPWYFEHTHTPPPWGVTIKHWIQKHIYTLATPPSLFFFVLKQILDYWDRLASNSEPSCLSFPTSWNYSMHNYAQLWGKKQNQKNQRWVVGAGKEIMTDVPESKYFDILLHTKRIFLRLGNGSSCL